MYLCPLCGKEYGQATVCCDLPTVPVEKIGNYYKVVH